MALASKMEIEVEAVEAMAAGAVAHKLKPQALLVSREAKPQDTVVHAGPVSVGGGGFTVIAGPCSVENPEQMLCTARWAQRYGAAILRGGAYKPRTSPTASRAWAAKAWSFWPRRGASPGCP